VSKHGHVDYKWLAAQPTQDVKNLVHPFSNANPGLNPVYHYQASTALIEMIAAKCSLQDILQLSVGSKLENYLATYCEIPDVNVEFRKWLQKKTQKQSSK
jgi:hypothetical protein